MKDIAMVVILMATFTFLFCPSVGSVMRCFKCTYKEAWELGFSAIASTLIVTVSVTFIGGAFLEFIEVFR